jgi:Mg2+-importing ATPase
MSDSSNDAFWVRPLDTLFGETHSRPAGLTSAEAAERLARVGPNAVAQAPHMRLAVKVAKRFAEPLVAILLVAAAISGFTGDTASFAIIVTVIVLSIVLDIVQEQRAEQAADALRRSVAIHADALRDGKLVSVPVEQLVPGDLVALRAGDLVPADGVIVEARNLHVNEALMTGEPYPVEKRAGDCAKTEPADAFNALFAATSVVSGEARMLVAATGRATRFGDIAASLAGGETQSAFERGIHRLGLLILRLTVFLVLFVLVVQFASGRPAMEAFLFAVALAVGLTPELLPMVMTVTLSRGALRMAAKRVVVKRLAAIHDLGAMDVLCTDKTGTLTEAHIRLVGHPGADGKDSERVLTLAGINSAFESGIRSPLDQAIVEHRGDDKRFQGWRKIDEVPFDFERRCVSVLAEHDGERILIIKGAPEPVLEKSATLDAGDGAMQPLDADRRAALERLQHEQATQGLRVLAVAWKRMPADCKEIRGEDERDLVIAGFCVFVDPPKASAAAAIARLAAAGVRVKVVSGDHEAVVRHLVETLKLTGLNMLTGAEIAALPDPALIARIDEVDLFARVSPTRRRASSAPCRRAATRSASSATESTTHPPSTPRRSAFRSTARPTWRAARPT